MWLLPDVARRRPELLHLDSGRRRLVPLLVVLLPSRDRRGGSTSSPAASSSAVDSTSRHSGVQRPSLKMAPSGTSSAGTVSVPKPPVTFNGVNYREFVQHMRIHLRGQRLWVYLTGERPCPPRPVPPTELVFPADATEDVQRAAVAAFEDALEEYQRSSTPTRCGTMGMLRPLPSWWPALSPSTRPMCLGCLRSRRCGIVLYLSVLQEEQSLQQQDATVDAFY